MKKAMYYENLKDKKVRCVLCPNNCIIKKDGFGICRVRQNLNGDLYTINDGFITDMNYDKVEKKPFLKYKPNNKVFSIGSYGCNLACDFCQNYKIVYDKTTMMKTTDKFIIEMMEKENSIGLAYTYNEPTVYYEMMIRLAKKVKKKGKDNLLITNGFINREPLKELLQYIDAVNIDLKAFNNEFYKDICKGNIEPVKENIKIASKYCHLEITTLLIDNRNTDREEIEKLAKFLGEIDEEIVLHLNRYYPAYKLNDPPTKIDTLVESKKIAEKYLENVYIGNVVDFDL